MPRKQPEAIWVVVLVKSGIPTMVEAYRDKKTARARETSLRKDINPDNDEVSLFEVKIGAQSPD